MQDTLKRETGLTVIGAQTLNLQGDVHKLVTFLNQTLKDRGLCFGISKREQGMQLTVYDTKDR